MRIFPVPSQCWAFLQQLRFLQLTLYILFFLFAFPFLGQEWVFKLFSCIFLLNALLVTLSASGRIVRLKGLFWLVFAASVIFTALYLLPLFPAERSLFLKLAITSEILLLLLCLTAILVFIFESREVTVDTIFAAVVAYLIIAVTFAQAYKILIYFSPNSFNLTADLAPSGFDMVHGDMIYYSFIVITTVGIGDIVPLTPAARMLTAIEGIVGQFFVAVLVAWLVGRFISQSGHKAPPPE
ncbi:MAG: two pore domain potassium channel family protein [Deltaproteobacteria bacterium]|nr:two pore domain potassium channel family protein [Deltaproteobacteria bacterium]